MGCHTSVPVGELQVAEPPPPHGTLFNRANSKKFPEFRSVRSSVEVDELRQRIDQLQQQLQTELIAKTNLLTTAHETERHLRQSELARQSLENELQQAQKQVNRLVPPIYILWDIENKPSNDIIQIECLLMYLERLLRYSWHLGSSHEPYQPELNVTTIQSESTPTRISTEATTASASPSSTTSSSPTSTPISNSPSIPVANTMMALSQSPTLQPTIMNSRSLIPLIPPPPIIASSSSIEVRFLIFGCVTTCGINKTTQEYLAKRNIPWNHVLNTQKDVADHALFTKLREVTRTIGHVHLPIPLCIVSADQDFCSRVKHEVESNGMSKDHVFIIGDNHGRPAPLATFPNYLSFPELLDLSTYYFKSEVDVRTNPFLTTLDTPTKPRIRVRIRPKPATQGTSPSITTSASSSSNTVASPIIAAPAGGGGVVAGTPDLSQPAATASVLVSPLSPSSPMTPPGISGVRICNSCRVSLPSKDELEQHVRSAHPQLACPVCHRIFRSMHQQKRHILSLHQTQTQPASQTSPSSTAIISTTTALNTPPSSNTAATTVESSTTAPTSSIAPLVIQQPLRLPPGGRPIQSIIDGATIPIVRTTSAASSMTDGYLSSHPGLDSSFPSLMDLAQSAATSSATHQHRPIQSIVDRNVDPATSLATSLSLESTSTPPTSATPLVLSDRSSITPRINIHSWISELVQSIVTAVTLPPTSSSVLPSASPVSSSMFDVSNEYDTDEATTVGVILFPSLVDVH